MITIKDKNAQDKMAKAGALLAQMFKLMDDVIKPDLTALELDGWIEEYLIKNNLTSCSKGYLGYKHASCISINDEVVHGVPDSNKKFKLGDLIKVDVCASFLGYCADMARCFLLGSVSSEIQDLVKVAYAALDSGIDQARSGRRLTDISAAIQQEVESHKYGIVREFAGHGIGKKMHEDPEILNYGRAGCGPILRPGMTFAIEPMITMGDYRIYIDKDGWTVKTVDKSYAAHVEDTVIVTENGPKIITRL